MLDFKLFNAKIRIRELGLFSFKSSYILVVLNSNYINNAKKSAKYFPFILSLFDETNLLQLVTIPAGNSG